MAFQSGNTLAVRSAGKGVVRSISITQIRLTDVPCAPLEENMCVHRTTCTGEEFQTEKEIYSIWELGAMRLSIETECCFVSNVIKKFSTHCRSRATSVSVVGKSINEKTMAGGRDERHHAPRDQGRPARITRESKCIIP